MRRDGVWGLLGTASVPFHEDDHVPLLGLSLFKKLGVLVEVSSSTRRNTGGNCL